VVSLPFDGFIIAQVAEYVNTFFRLDLDVIRLTRGSRSKDRDRIVRVNDVDGNPGDRVAPHAARAADSLHAGAADGASHAVGGAAGDLHLADLEDFVPGEKGDANGIVIHR